MKLDKAIEIGTNDLDHPTHHLFATHREAEKILIEAGKRIQVARLQRTDVPLHLLPGETEE